MRPWLAALRPGATNTPEIVARTAEGTAMGGFRPGLARLAAFAALLLGAALSLGATAQESDIGEAISIVKSVRGVIANKERVLAPKDRVFADEQILTGPASASLLRFLDYTVLTNVPDSDVLPDEFVFNAAPENHMLVFNANGASGMGNVSLPEIGGGGL